MMREIFSAMRSSGLKNGAGDPAVTLVIIRVGALEEREAAVLRFEWGLQVGGVVDGMGPGVAGEKFKRVREALGQIDGQAIVSGIAAGFLCVHAIEGDGNSETCWVSGGLCERDLGGVTDGGIAAASRGREGRIRPRWAEEIKKCRRANKLSVECGDRATE